MKPAIAVGGLVWALSIATCAFAEEPAKPAVPAASLPVEAAAGVFAQARELCDRDRGVLWGASLCAPIMLVEPNTRRIVASQADADGALQAQGAVFVGVLPAKDNAANTATRWSGTHWTQMLWPLPDDSGQRAVLIGHELFHRLRPQLRIASVDGGDNPHLDTLEGRYWLQLEWRALAAALGAGEERDQRRAIDDALAFREQRYRLFASAATDEAALELNEGLAEYTGVMLGETAPQRRIDAALRDLRVHVDDPSFVRSFAYATGPAYGLLLDRHAPRWRESLATPARLDRLLRTALPQAADVAADTATSLQTRAARYDGARLREAEVERDRTRQRTLARNRARFVDGAVLALPLMRMQIQFDPRNPQPLGEYGTVYPTLRISDEWGTLEVGDGALMKPDWSRVILVAPTQVGEGDEHRGPGWTLRLKPGWRLAPDARKDGWTLVQDLR